MIELYAFTVLSLAGYLLTRSSNSTTSHYQNANGKILGPTAAIPPLPTVSDDVPHANVSKSVRRRVTGTVNESGGLPSSGIGSDVYEMTNLRESKEAERVLALAQSRVNARNGVQELDRPGNNTADKKKLRSLTGDMIDNKDFLGSDVLPFFGSSVKQNVEAFGNQGILDTQTGYDPLYASKREVGSMFDTTRESGNVNGNSADFYEIEKGRMDAGFVRSNELPFEQTRVGPGFNQDASEIKGTGGFHQYEVQDFAKPPTVDELRVGSNPKETYAARTVDGLKVSVPGQPGELAKNRVDTYYEQTPDMFLRTTGARLKETTRPKHVFQETHRTTTTGGYEGAAAVGAEGQKPPARSRIAPSSRNVLSSFEPGVARLDEYGAGTCDDYGLKGIVIKPNERECTTEATSSGNISTVVKAITAPITDALRFTKKEHTLQSARPYGQMNVQIPEKMTVYDTDDVLRTTVKETLIHDTVVAGLQMQMPSKGVVYDTDETARTTLKETLIHDTVTAGIQLPSRGVVYDPEEVARKTVRETLDQIDVANLKGENKHQVYDPDDVLRTTMRETTEEERRAGNIGGVEDKKAGGYHTAPTDMHNTQKQFISDHEYSGAPGRQDANGFETAPRDMPNTQKQFVSDHNYTGASSAGSEIAKHRVYDTELGSRVNTTKELTLRGRTPAGSSNKVFNSKLNNFQANRKIPDNMGGMESCTESAGLLEPSKNIPSKDNILLTHGKTQTSEDAFGDRLDAALLDAFRENPYTHSLNSAV